MSLRYLFLAFVLLVAVDGPAKANTLYVSGKGANNIFSFCPITAPCNSLSLAVSVASAGDTIICLDSFASSGSFTISKSIDIDCSAARHVIRDNTSGSGVVAINISSGPSDPTPTVHLRGISIIGGPFNSFSVEIISAAAVYLENITIADTLRIGIYDHRTGGQTRLYIVDSIIRNGGGPGIVAAAAAPGTTVLDNVRSENNTYGFAAAAGNNVVINRSVFSGNSTAGVEGDGGAQVVVNNSTISHNGIGVQGSSSIRLSHNDIAFNSTAISGVAGTFGNNRFSGNGTIGTPPTALGGASSDLGQQ